MLRGVLERQILFQVRPHEGNDLIDAYGGVVAEHGRVSLAAQNVHARGLDQLLENLQQRNHPRDPKETGDVDDLADESRVVDEELDATTRLAQ